MEIFKSRPGVVLTEIAGEYVLVAARSLLKQCPYVTQINESSAFLWRQLEKGASLKDLQSAVAEEYELDDAEEANAAIGAFVQQMKDLNYLLTEESEAAL